MIGLIDVFESINHTLKANFKGLKVYKERIRKLDRPVLSVELISFSTTNHSRSIINKSVDLDIIYFSPNNNIGEALTVMDKLMSAFSLGLYVRVYNKDKEIIEKRFIHCLKAPEYKFVDQDLHFLVKFDFADGFNPTYLSDYGKIEEFNGKSRTNTTKHINSPDKYKDVSKEEIEPIDFVKDISFKSDEQERSYKDEDLKLMKSLLIQYEITEV